MNLGSPTMLEINPNAETTEFQFLLTFPEQPQSVEFRISAESLMMLMVGLQRLQVQHRIPIPSSVRPEGRPQLRVVTENL